MKRKNRLFLGFALMKGNLKTILVFELLYKLVGAAIFTPMVLGLFNLALRLAKLKYLSNDNVPYFLSRPATIGILLLIFIFFLLFTLLEIASVIQCYHASYYRKKILVTQMLQGGIKTVLKVFTGNNWLLFIFIICIVPLMNLSLISGYVSSISIPSFIKDYLSQNRWIGLLLILALIGLSVQAVRWIYSLHLFTLEPGNYNQARKKSLIMNQNHYGRNIAGLLLWNFLILLLLFLTAIAGAIGIAGIIKIFSTSRVAFSLALGVAAGAIIIIFIIFANFMVPITFSFISAMYYDFKYQRGEEAPAYVPVFQKHEKTSKIIGAVIVVAACINLFYVSVFANDDFSLHVQFLNKPMVTAHRGDSVSAPENTMPAFYNAIENHADYIELDVQQTKDGTIIVMHDSNLKRTTGLDKNIWEVTYEEIKDLDAGSWFSKEFSDTRIPTLKEVLEYCKGTIKLNIELKPTGHEVNFEKCVIDLIRQYSHIEDCVVASMKYDCIQKVKELEPQIKTVYVTAVAYGNLNTLEYADIVSIEASFITNKLVNRLHESGKIVYAWTVNEEDMMQTMMDVGVDNIITDHTVLARESIYTKSMNENFVDFITDLFN